MATFAFKTLGCRLNQAESDSMADELLAGGLDPAHSDASPDVVVVNTCTVTREATKASRSAIRRAVRNNPDSKVVVVGCYAVSNPEEIEAIDGVDVILGNTDKERFAEALQENPPMSPLLQLAPPARTKEPATRVATPSATARVRANLKVQTGCDEWCTFCIIPTTRGDLRSFDVESLVGEARAKAAAGARELVLTGVHLGKYAYDIGGGERELIELMGRLLDIDEIARLRLSSIFPRHLTNEVLEFMSREPRVCRYLHVPLQAGDDDVLTAMHRPYRIEEYIEAVDRAKEALEGLALATDIIVGFPGETDAAFEATLDVVRRVGFSKLHVFRYSARPDTPAATMEEQVPVEVKKERSKRLIELGNELRADFLSRHLDSAVEVLVEDRREVEGVTISSGQTDDYVRCWFEGDCELGSIVEIAGKRIRADGIEGTLLRTVR